MALLFPYHRSITGAGVRKTLSIIRDHIPLRIHEVPSGTRVLDWQIPDEWTIRDAYIKDARGRRVLDYAESTLHVVNSSVPVHKTVSLDELREHVHSLPDRPDWIPYRYAHYQPSWGFCMRHRDLEELRDPVYEVMIDSEFSAGALTYGECILPGEIEDEVLFSCHICHPELANDNLSGIAIATEVARALRQQRLRYTYRFVFVPSTIGAIAWLARNPDCAKNVRHGLVLSNLGDPGDISYKRSRRGDAEIDRIVEHLLIAAGRPCNVRSFTPYGYDERQYNSPGFNLPVGLLTRTPHDCYPEYHTSADNLDFVTRESLADSFAFVMDVINVIETNRTYRNTSPEGEPELGRRGLYRKVAGQTGGREHELPYLWVLSFSDGAHSLLDIAARAGLPYNVVERAASRLLEAGLLGPDMQNRHAAAAVAE